MRIVWVAFAVTFSILAVLQPAHAQKRVALVIGNSAYEHTTQLKNPYNDAADIGAVLKKLGFETVEGRDLDKRAMERAVRQFGIKLSGADVALFFYAGHGMQVSGQNHLVPVDARLVDEGDIDFESVPLGLVLKQMEREAKTSLVLLDACRDNPLAGNLARSRGARSTQIAQGLAEVKTGVGTLIAFSTHPGNVALDGEGRNSPYAEALLKHIESTGKDVGAVLNAVRGDVVKATNGKQVPWEHTSLIGSVYFKAPASESSASAGEARKGDGEAEIAFWNSVKDSKQAIELQTYVDRFPSGVYSDLARVKIERLRKEEFQWKVVHAVETPAQRVARLSIIVLPFENLTGDQTQEYFVDGVTQDLTTDLSRMSGSFVIARNTAFTFKGKAVDIKQVGRDLGVRYALEGSVRRAGERVRITTQLIETANGVTLWAERIDVDRTKLSELQEHFTSQLANVLNVELINAEGRRAPVSSPDAIDQTMRAWSILNGQHTRENLDRAVGLLEDALRLEPDHTEALIGLAHALTRIFYARFADDPKAVVARADAAATKALAVAPNNARAHYAKGEVLQVRKQFDAALAEYMAATTLDPNLAAAYGSMGRTVLLSGRSDETFALVQRAIKLSPRDPLLFDWYFLMCHAHSHLGNYDPAIEWCRKSAAVGSLWMTHVDLISAFGWKGRLEDAKAERANLDKFMPNYTVKKWADRGPTMSEHPTFLAEYARIVEGLRKSGMPEE